jgi:hypothetical protein
LAVHVIGALPGTMILAVTLKRPELMDEVAHRLRQILHDSQSGETHN